MSDEKLTHPLRFPQIKIEEQRGDLWWSFLAETIIRVKDSETGKYYLTNAVRAKRIGNIELSRVEKIDDFLNRERSSAINMLNMDAYMMTIIGKVNPTAKSLADGALLFELDEDQRSEEERLKNLFR